MKGYKTLLFGLLLAIGSPGLHYLAGVDWTALFGPVWSGVIAGVLSIALRIVTDTPIGTPKDPIKPD